MIFLNRFSDVKGKPFRKYFKVFGGRNAFIYNHDTNRGTSATGTDSLVGERFLIAAERKENVEEKRKAETVEMRLDRFLTAQLQHMHDHG